MAKGMDEQFQDLIDKGEKKIAELEFYHKFAIEKLERSHRAEVNSLRDQFETKFNSELEAVKVKSRNAIVGVISFVLIGFIVFLYTVASDISSKTDSVNQSVITLQNSLIAARTAISSVEEDLTKAKEEATREVAEARSIYTEAVTSLEEAKRDLKVANSALAETERTYIQRLQELSPDGER